jgi:hypothetical protein
VRFVGPPRPGPLRDRPMRGNRQNGGQPSQANPGPKKQGRSVTNAKMAFSNMSRATYAPQSLPPDPYVVGFKGLSTISFTAGHEIGSVQLRDLLQKAGPRGKTNARLPQPSKGRRLRTPCNAGRKIHCPLVKLYGVRWFSIGQLIMAYFLLEHCFGFWLFGCSWFPRSGSSYGEPAVQALRFIVYFRRDLSCISEGKNRNSGWRRGNCRGRTG